MVMLTYSASAMIAFVESKDLSIYRSKGEDELIVGCQVVRWIKGRRRSRDLALAANSSAKEIEHRALTCIT